MKNKTTRQVLIIAVALTLSFFVYRCSPTQSSGEERINEDTEASRVQPADVSNPATSPASAKSLPQEEKELTFPLEDTRDTLRINDSTLIVLSYDNQQTDYLTQITKEEEFNTGSDDYMYYNYELQSIARKAGMTVLQSKANYLYIKTGTGNTLIKKEELPYLFSYYLYLGDSLKKQDLFECMETLSYTAEED